MRASRVLALLAVIALNGCEPNDNVFGSPSESFNVLYDLTGEGFGKSYGTLRITSDGDEAEVCWNLAVEHLPKAVQLHEDITGPSDPVVDDSLYEPPGPREASGCRPLDQEVAVRVRSDPGNFYLDGHNSDDDPVPDLWAALTRPER